MKSMLFKTRITLLNRVAITLSLPEFSKNSELGGILNLLGFDNGLSQDVSLLFWHFPAENLENWSARGAAQNS